jgi:hypothetical protein
MKEPHEKEPPTECPGGHPTLDEALECWRCQRAAAHQRRRKESFPQKGEDDENRQLS